MGLGDAGRPLPRRLVGLGRVGQPAFVLIELAQVEVRNGALLDDLGGALVDLSRLVRLAPPLIDAPHLGIGDRILRDQLRRALIHLERQIILLLGDQHPAHGGIPQNLLEFSDLFIQVRYSLGDFIDDPCIRPHRPGLLEFGQGLAIFPRRALKIALVAGGIAAGGVDLAQEEVRRAVILLQLDRLLHGQRRLHELVVGQVSHAEIEEIERIGLVHLDRRRDLADRAFQIALL